MSDKLINICDSTISISCYGDNHDDCGGYKCYCYCHIPKGDNVSDKNKIDTKAIYETRLDNGETRKITDKNEYKIARREVIPIDDRVNELEDKMDILEKKLNRISGSPFVVGFNGEDGK